MTTVLWRYIFSKREGRMNPRRRPLNRGECIMLKNAISLRLVHYDWTPVFKKPRVRYKLTLKCKRIHVRDHRAWGGFTAVNKYYYQ